LWSVPSGSIGEKITHERRVFIISLPGKAVRFGSPRLAKGHDYLLKVIGVALN